MIFKVRKVMSSVTNSDVIVVEEKFQAPFMPEGK